jgi:hypothetical protein
MKPVRCPTCQLRWNIRDDMPPFFTCPRCLKALKNPYPSIAFPETTVKPPPLPVIPIERQTTGDMRIAFIGLAVVIVAVGVGIVTLLLSGVNGASLDAIVVIGLLLCVASCIGVAIYSQKFKTTASPTPAVVPLSPAEQSARRVIDYRHPAADIEKLSGSAFFAQAIVGIITGIVAMVLLAMLGGFPALAAPAIGIALLFHPKWRGLGLGLLLAFPVAFLLLLGFCAIMLSGANWHGS